MPRLSLYRPEKGNDYKFIDKTAWEMFQVGGTDVLVHKYIGPGSSTEATPTTPNYVGNSVSNIQDLLFLENRDRKYDTDIYQLRGVYSLQDIDFNLSQFGLFLQNDTIFITFHINDTVEKLGRKIISGDVIELPHLKDEYALNDFQFALKRFFVVEEVNRAAEGFSVTWYPHLYRAKCKPLVDSQEFKEILDGAAGEGSDQSLRDIMSTYEKEMQITQAVLNQAESDAPNSGYDTTRHYMIQKDVNGKVELVDASLTTSLASFQTQATDAEGNLLFDQNNDPIYVGNTASTIYQSPEYDGPVTGDGDGIPPNGAPFSAGNIFPNSNISPPSIGEFFLRTDFLPKRLFRYNGTRWVKVEDVTRMTMSNMGAEDVVAGGSPNDVFLNKDVRLTHKTSFINNNVETVLNGKTIKEKQSLSKALRPKADE